MRLRIIRRLGEAPEVVEGVQAVLAESDAGAPLVVAGETGMVGVCQVAHCMDEDFEQVLSDLGMDRTVVSSWEWLKTDQH